MGYTLIIFYYFIAAAVDIMDKFLLSARKIRPLSYTFFTVVTGLVLLVVWPWNYQAIAGQAVFLDLLSGVLFSLAMYVFFKALSEGEVSRVVPFIFAIVPLTDLLMGLLFGRNVLTVKEMSAMSLLLPGALLIIYRKKDFIGKHVLLKFLSAFLWSAYYALWQFSAGEGSVLNHLMWNRLGSALILVILLIAPLARKEIFASRQIKNKTQTSVLFLLKQFLGGMNFIYLSFLLIFFKISIVNGLQGFRYIFLFLGAILLSMSHKHVLTEQLDKTILWQKLVAVAMIFAGTTILFM